VEGPPTLGLDPVLKYKAANYLFQEVQLLNQEVDNIASRSCYVPYVVKLKLAVMNYRPRLPYSAHVHIGFTYNGRLASHTRAASHNADLPPFNAQLSPQCSASAAGSPVVVPFLVADDVQTALRSRAAEAASQVAFGISALIHGAAVAGNANSLQEGLTAIANHDLTSTLTVGREAEDSLYALITPNNQASNQAELTSETYDVAVLLLVPRNYFGDTVDPQSPTIAVSTFTEYRDASSGKLLAEAPDAALAEAADHVIPQALTPSGLRVWRQLTTGQKTDEARRLAEAVKTGSVEVFSNTINCAGPNQFPPSEVPSSRLCGLFVGRFTEALWTASSSLLDYDNEKLALLQAQLPSPIKVPSQQVVLSDDGTHPIQAVLGAVQARSTAKLAAFLHVTPYAEGKAQQPVTVPAQAVTLDAPNHTLTLTFPSLKKLQISCLAPASPPAAVPPSQSTPKPAPKKGVKGANAANGQTDASAKADCPARGADAGTAVAPNMIELSLVGCDPATQLCQLLTQTVLNNEERVDRLQRAVAALAGPVGDDVAQAQQALTEATSQRSNVEAAIATIASRASAGAPGPVRDQLARDLEFARQQEAQAKTDAEAANAESTALQAAVVKLADLRTAVGDEEAALALLTGAAAGNAHAAAEAALDQARAARATKESAALQALSAAHADDLAADVATLGVSLFASPPSTEAGKVAFSNVGPAVQLTSDGLGGTLVATLTPTTATDTIALSVQGADLKSVVDSTGTAIVFNAKHGFVLPQAGIYTLSLTGLTEGVAVQVKAQALKGAANDGDAVTQTYQVLPPRAGRQGSSP
jgi:hypothetical protein